MKLIVDLCKEYVTKVHCREFERRDREGFGKLSDAGELTAWEGIASWPEK